MKEFWYVCGISLDLKRFTTFHKSTRAVESVQYETFPKLYLLYTIPARVVASVEDVDELPVVIPVNTAISPDPVHQVSRLS